MLKKTFSVFLISYSPMESYVFVIFLKPFLYNYTTNLNPPKKKRKQIKFINVHCLAYMDGFSRPLNVELIYKIFYPVM